MPIDIVLAPSSLAAFRVVVIAAALFIEAGCDRTPAATAVPVDAPSASAALPASAAAASAQRPIASLRDIMDALVDPNADALWDSVGTVATKQGTVEKQPHTPAEWLTVKRQALTLAEAANLLLVDGRQVVLANESTDDAKVKGILPPDQIKAKIDANRPRFVRAALRLQDAAGQALAAIDAHDAAKLIDAGDALDKACEQCHATYWYPEDRRPTPDWPPQPGMPASAARS